MAAGKSVTVALEVERTTKNTVRFSEVTEGEFVVQKLGQMYVPNHTLGEIDFTGSEQIEIEIRLKK